MSAIVVDLSERFKAVRKERGLTQKQVANALGIAESAYQKYEYGTNVPGAYALIAIAECFDVSLDYLTGRTDNPEINR